MAGCRLSTASTSRNESTLALGVGRRVEAGVVGDDDGSRPALGPPAAPSGPSASAAATLERAVQSANASSIAAVLSRCARLRVMPTTLRTFGNESTYTVSR